MCVCLNVVVNKRDDDHSVLWKLRNRVKTSKHKNTNTKIYIYEHDHSFHSWNRCTWQEDLLSPLPQFFHDLEIVFHK